MCISIKAFVCALLFYMLLPLMLVAWFILYVKMKVIELFARKLKGVSSILSANCQSEIEVRNNIITLELVLSGKISLSDFKQKFVQRYSVSENDCHHLRDIVIYVLGYPFWLHDTNFKLENHVRSHLRTDRVTSLHGMENVRDQILQQSFNPFKQSPWEIIFTQFTNAKSEVCTSLFFKFHHVLGDGHTVFHIISALLDEEVVMVKPQSTLHPTSHLYNNFDLIWTFLRTPYDLCQIFLNLSKVKCPWALEQSGLRVCATSEKIQLSNLKDIGKFSRAGVTSALIAGIASGILRSSLYNLIKSDTMLFVLPLQHPNRTKKEMGYPASPIAYFELPLEEVDDQEAFVQKTQILLRNALMSSLSSQQVAKLLGYLFDSFRVQSKPGNLANKVFAISNIPGPTKPVFINGYKCEDIILGSQIPGICGTIFTIISYCGNIRIGVNADKSLIADKQVAMGLLREIENQLKLKLNNCLVNS